MKRKLNFRIFAACYCAVLLAIILFTSLPYASDRDGFALAQIDFSSGWSVSENGGPFVDGTTLPYDLEGRVVSDLELRSTIPPYSFQTAVLETVIFQKDIRVYIDGTCVMERVFEAKHPNQTTPGSGRIFVPLPQDAQGKEVVIQLHNIVLEDDGPIAKISILDGMMNNRSIISLTSSAFLATVLMFFVGVCLLISCIAYIPSGVKIRSLCSMAMFVISASLWVLCNSKAMQYFTDNWVLSHNLEYIAFFSTPLWLWLFLSYHWDSHKKLCNTAINLLTVFLLITFTAKAFGIRDYYFFLKTFHILAVVNIIVILLLGIKDLRKQPIALKIFFLGIGGLCFTSVIDLVRYYTVFSPDAMAFFFILGIIFMGICLLMTFIIMTKDKFVSAVEDSIYKELAFTDILTGLSSRAKWEADISHIEEGINACRDITTAMIDVNNLKKVNDEFGHHEGDRLLTTVTGALKARFHEIGSCYRLGGDEFCVIMLDRPLDMMVDTLSLVVEDLNHTALPYPISFAWGCAKYNPEIHESLSDTLREADNLMYELKRKVKSGGDPSACRLFPGEQDHTQ